MSVKKVARIFLLLIILSGPQVLGEESQEFEVALKPYIETCINCSAVVIKAEKEVEAAETAYLRARKQGWAAMDIESLAIAYQTARLYAQEMRGQEMIRAVQRYFALSRAEQELTTAKKKLEIAEQKLKIKELRLASGLQSTNEVLTEKNLLLAVEEKKLEAEDEYDQARQEFFRAIKLEPKSQVFLRIYQSLNKEPRTYDLPASLHQLRTTSSKFYSAQSTYTLMKRKREALQDPELTTEGERKKVAEELRSAEQNLVQAERATADLAEELVNDHQSLVRKLQLERRTIELARRQLTLAKIQLVNGEILASDLEQSAVDYQEALERLAQTEGSIYLQELRIAAACGEELWPLLQYLTVAGDH
ncbi:MAG TPA: hypothetical protein DDW93_01490 [Firmicutes bacterium]|jgi:outer membrane protein TolC|nr:hypothetical protein [Bacillota bacterium]